MTAKKQDAVMVSPYADMMGKLAETGQGIESLQKLMDMEERWQAGQSKRAYLRALSEFQAIAPPLEKVDKAHNSKYCKLDRVLVTLRDPMRQCCLVHRWEIGNDGQQYTVTCIISHVDGHSERTTMTAPVDTSGSKSAVQGAGSTVSYLKRYTLEAALGLCESGEDTDAATWGPITDRQAELVARLIEESGVADDWQAKALKYGGVTAWADFPADKFAAVRRSLENMIRDRKAARK